VDRHRASLLPGAVSRLAGERITIDEVGLYTVKDGKIVEGRFFY